MARVASSGAINGGTTSAGAKSAGASPARSEPAKPPETSEFLDMEPIPVGRVIDRLEKTGFIERRADPGDRRRWRLYLKPKAHAVVDEMEVIAAELRDEALRDIPRADLDALMRALTQMKENLVALDATANEERGTS